MQIKNINIGSLTKEKEVDEAIQSLNLNKYLGIDGITAKFYQTFRPLLTPILAELYSHFLFQGILPKQFKQGIITFFLQE